jgi:protein HOOK3
MCFLFHPLPPPLLYFCKETNTAQVELQQEVENLRRENALITSAWYDMTTRLQSNTVILQRRSEAPKGWLGKQRAAVGGGAGVLVR